ncbi:MAG: hypothetical protein JNM69_02635 [Archangium sp.]|nr:hypothetical protein [Archangium sp.]
MPLTQGDSLGDGWVLERLGADSVRFSRPPSVDRQRAVSRLVVMGGCLVVTLALVGVSVQNADNLWLITSSLIVLFGLTTLLALLAAVKDLRRAALGVFLEIDRARVRGVVDGQGFGQFRVGRVELPRAEVTLTLTPFEDSKEGAGMLVVTTKAGARLLAPDLPKVHEVRPLLDRLS